MGTAWVLCLSSAPPRSVPLLLAQALTVVLYTMAYDRIADLRVLLQVAAVFPQTTTVTSAFSLNRGQQLSVEAGAEGSFSVIDFGQCALRCGGFLYEE